MKPQEKIFVLAPMMEWTDRHGRYLHRLPTRRARLYTEMVTVEAVIRAAVAHVAPRVFDAA